MGTNRTQRRARKPAIPPKEIPCGINLPILRIFFTLLIVVQSPLYRLYRESNSDRTNLARCSRMSTTQSHAHLLRSRRNGSFCVNASWNIVLVGPYLRGISGTKSVYKIIFG